MKDIIAYDDFAKLDIAIGTITAVEIVEDADKLLKLTVDIGEEQPRQIISGIRAFFPDTEALIGKQCPFLVNLEPRMIRGLQSQGMILACGEGDIFSLLSPDNELPRGMRIR